jgi:SAM-dependent MidA family methyltransferase
LISNVLDVESVVEEIKNELKKSYRCSIADYMNTALFHSIYGYYNTSDPLVEDFVTPSTLSQAFNETLAEWVIEQNRPNTIEYGGGTGLTAESILKAIPNQPYYLIEKSLKCRVAQERKLRNKNVSWVNSLQSPIEAVVLLQEVFDCLPAHWYCVDEAENVKEIVVNTKDWTLEQQDRDQEESLFFLEKKVSKPFQLMYSPLAQELIRSIYHQLEQGTVFILDYGDRFFPLTQALAQVKCPVRAYKKHQQLKDFLHVPGTCDLTYDVNFDFLMETWLECSGTVRYYGTLANFLLNQTNFLTKACPYTKILLDPRCLGEAFKVLILDKG